MNAPPISGKIEWMLLGVACGDALGVPTEMKTAEKIRERFGRVTGFLPTRHNAMFVKDGFSKDSDESGYYSDDTVLTFATVRSIAKTGGIDHRDLVSEQLRASEAWPYGFWRATTEAFKNIREGSDPLESGLDTAGNGVLMKQSPLAAYAVATGTDEFRMEREVAAYARVTHRSPEAVVASIVHHKALVGLLLGNDPNGYEFLSGLRSYARKIEKNPVFASGLKDSVAEKIDRVLRYCGPSEGMVTAEDSEIFAAFDWGEKMGASCYALTTLWIAYSLYFRSRDFDAVFDAVNFGGDTDSYAGIIASMLGAEIGTAFPDSYGNGMKGMEGLKLDVRNFFETFRMNGK